MDRDYWLTSEFHEDRSILYNLAKNGKTIWERRIGIVSTMAFIRRGELDDTYAIADIFLDGKPLHDLLQKAVGWLKPRLRSLPRTMLRYAIEKFPEEQRKNFLRSFKRTRREKKIATF